MNEKVMKRNEKEWKGMKRNKNGKKKWFSPEMTENDRENDRKRPRKWVILLEVEEWIPRKFPDFPCIFLENSPIFPEIFWFSPIFSDILRIFS